MSRVRTAWRWVVERRREHKAWGAAKSYGDLCDLMVRWLEGEFERWPGHLGPPCPETQELIPTLVKLNRAGYLTIASQPGVRGVHYEQRAAVEGYVQDGRLLKLLHEEAGAAGLRVVVWPGPSLGWTNWMTDVERWGVAVTRSHPAHEVFTDFGGRLTAHELGSSIFPGCRRSAVNAVRDSFMVTVVDEEWGWDGLLWPTLERVVDLWRAGCSAEDR